MEYIILIPGILCGIIILITSAKIARLISFTLIASPSAILLYLFLTHKRCVGDGCIGQGVLIVAVVIFIITIILFALIKEFILRKNKASS
jgi:hypothetical protein